MMIYKPLTESVSASSSLVLEGFFAVKIEKNIH